MSNINKPIGVFDSGVGGLTVVKSLRKRLPHEDIIYFGDTARVPYGNKSKATIKRFSREIINFLLDKDVKLIVAACNTASSLAVPYIKDSYNIPVMGVIESGVKEAFKKNRNKKIGVIGTDSTIASGSYEKALRKISGNCKIYTKSCPLFVPLVENRMISDKITYMAAEKYLVAFKKAGIDTLILGCTHYPVLKNVIKNVLKKVSLVDSADAVSSQVEKILCERGELRKRSGGKGRVMCFASDDVKGFIKTSRIFLKENISAKKAVL